MPGATSSPAPEEAIRELKPCPFCGQPPSMEMDDWHSTAWYLGCGACDKDHNLTVRLWAETKAAAIAAWNRRAGDERERELELELEAAVNDCWGFQRRAEQLEADARVLATAMTENKPQDFEAVNAAVMRTLYGSAPEGHTKPFTTYFDSQLIMARHAALAEREQQLEAALNKIAGGFIDTNCILGQQPPDWRCAFDQLQSIARTALGGGNGW